MAHMQPSSWQFGGLQPRLTSAQTEHNALQLGTGPGRNGRTWRVAKAQGAAMSPAGVEQPPPASLRRPTPTQPGSRNSADLARAGAEQTLLKNLTWTQLQSWCAARGTMVHHACFAHRDCPPVGLQHKEISDCATAQARDLSEPVSCGGGCTTAIMVGPAAWRTLPLCRTA